MPSRFLQSLLPLLSWIPQVRSNVWPWGICLHQSLDEDSLISDNRGSHQSGHRKWPVQAIVAPATRSLSWGQPCTLVGISLASGFYLIPQRPLSSHLSALSPPSTPQPNPSSSHAHPPQVHPGDLLYFPFPVTSMCSRASLGLWIVARLSFTLQPIFSYE